MYLCICETCDDKVAFQKRQKAQKEFNRHAEQKHEVILERIEKPPPEVVSEIETPDELSEPRKCDGSGEQHEDE
jgi:hypothetical protein